MSKTGSMGELETQVSDMLRVVNQEVKQPLFPGTSWQGVTTSYQMREFLALCIDEATAVNKIGVKKMFIEVQTIPELDTEM
eukprot:5763168-Amphidinium_carterae.1